LKDSLFLIHPVESIKDLELVKDKKLNGVYSSLWFIEG